MKIYTRTGDQGETGLFGGTRIKKSDARVEALGTVDELNAVLGQARALGLSPGSETIVARVQGELFTLGAELGCAPEQLDRFKNHALWQGAMALLDGAHVASLETAIDEAEADLPPLKTFILPTGSPAGACLHLARTVCRRAERRTLDVPEVRQEVVIYLNRLSDLLFVLARHQNHVDETPETPWSGRQSL